MAECPDKKSREGCKIISILHVKDNKLVADLVRKTREREGWSVETCEDGNSALEKISGPAEYDLILLDNNSPGIRGLELLRRARMIAHRREIPIVMFSFAQINEAAMLAGANEFLRKPQDIGALGETIKRLVGGDETKRH